MHSLTGYWTGDFVGTNVGGVTLDIKQVDDQLFGVGKFHEPALGFYEYSISGRVAEKIFLSLTPARNPRRLVLGRVDAIVSHSDRNTVSGRWKSEIGTEGVITVRRHDADLLDYKLPKNNSVFIVHGHDEGAKQSVARFVEKLGIKPVILHEQLNNGMTILEKFLQLADRAAYAVVLMTPDDRGHEVGCEAQIRYRARQNVILELGYFAAKLGRDRTLVLMKGDIDLPSDLFGLIYERMDDGEGWRMRLARELRAAGFPIDMNAVL